MRIYLAGAETGHSAGCILDVAKLTKLNWNLFSYYYIQKADITDYFKIRQASKSVLIDSGAHSFQKGKKVDWDNFTKEYTDFIQETDNHKVFGYFEMDVDNIIGYDKVLELRRIMEEVTDKVIPVWHKERGIKDFKQMCNDYEYVSVSGWHNEDIKDDQFIHFVRYAHRKGCRIHGLGLTRKKVLDKVPFDSTDSSSWLAPIRYGNINGKWINRDYSRTHQKEIKILSYIKWMKIQEEYYNKWSGEE